jgi:hypothetical protein
VAGANAAAAGAAAAAAMQHLDAPLRVRTPHGPAQGLLAAGTPTAAVTLPGSTAAVAAGALSSHTSSNPSSSSSSFVGSSMFGHQGSPARSHRASLDAIQEHPTAHTSTTTAAGAVAAGSGSTPAAAAFISRCSSETHPLLAESLGDSPLAPSLAAGESAAVFDCNSSSSTPTLRHWQQQQEYLAGQPFTFTLEQTTPTAPAPEAASAAGAAAAADVSESSLPRPQALTGPQLSVLQRQQRLMLLLKSLDLSPGKQHMHEVPSAGGGLWSDAGGGCCIVYRKGSWLDVLCC